MRATNTFRALCLGALLGLSGCMTVHHDYEDDYGPPAYGPRYHHYGVDHLYNAQLGLYTVVGYPHTYWHGGSYWRHSNGYWERCARPRGGHWSRADWQHVPHRLRPRYGDPRGDHRDRRDRRDVRKHERNEHAVQPRVQREENWQDRHARTGPRHDPLDARKELKRDQKSERKVQRHELGDGRHDRRDAGQQVRPERAEQRHDPLDARKDLKQDQRNQHKVERHERKNERRQEGHENRDAHDRYAREQGSE